MKDELIAYMRAGFDPAFVAREKARNVRKAGILEIIEPKETAADIGGLSSLKTWLAKRKRAFTPEAVEYGLPTPKGVLIIGIPGTGKSLTAKAAASILERPILKLDAGRLFAGIVGESEAIWRIHLAARGRDPGAFDIDGFVKASDGYTGSEIEQAVIDALFDSFDAGAELSGGALDLAVRRAVPLSSTMAEDVRALRKWATGRARCAGGDAQASATGGRRVSVDT